MMTARPLVAPFLDQAQQRFVDGKAQRHQRLVYHDQARRADHGPRDGNDLALLAGQVARLFAQRSKAHAQPVEDASGFALHALLIGAAQPGHPERRSQLSAQKDIAGNVQVFGQVSLLMNHLDAQGAHHVRAKDAHALPVEIHIAAAGFI